jgi:hypothetical protein
MDPSNGQAPVSQTFGPPGGEIEASVTTQSVSAVSVAWKTNVAFAPASWPPMPASGLLNSANIWTDMLKPDSWITTFTFMAIPVDSQGKAQNIATIGADYHAQGAVNFTAPYVPNGFLNCAFDRIPSACHRRDAVLPRATPGVPPPDHVLDEERQGRNRRAPIERE